jgi:fatty acid desaturase
MRRKERAQMLGFSWGAFLVYLVALCFMVLGGLWGLFESHSPAFLAPILLGLFFFYLCWEAVVEDEGAPPPRSKQH